MCPCRPPGARLAEPPPPREPAPQTSATAAALAAPTVKPHYQQRITAPSLASHPEVFTTRAQNATRKQRSISRFLRILLTIGCASTLLAQLHNRPTYEALKKNTASTLDRYLRCVEQFLDYLNMWQCNIGDCTWPCVADYLHSAQQSKICDRACQRTPPVMCVKALRWFAKHAQVEGLAAAMYMPIISAYTLRDEPRDRREAMPLPMACVIAWEQCVCNCLAPVSLRLLSALHCYAYTPASAGVTRNALNGAPST